MKTKQEVADQLKEIIRQYNELQEEAKNIGLKVNAFPDRGYSGNIDTGKFQIFVYESNRIDY